MPVQTPPIERLVHDHRHAGGDRGPGGSSTTELRLTAPRRFAPGSFSEAVGGVLSIRRGSTGAPSVTLPATSVATVRKKYRPSGSEAVSNDVRTDPSCPMLIVDQERAGGAISKTTFGDARAGVARGALDRRRSPRRFAPGSSIAVAGGELSTRRSSTAAACVSLPALSVTTTRRS